MPLKLLIAAVTILGAFIALNAGSFLFRGSRGIMGMDVIYAIGFPLEFWCEGGFVYRSHFLLKPLFINIALALVVTGIGTLPLSRLVQLPQDPIPRVALRGLAGGVLLLCVGWGIQSLLPDSSDWIAWYSLDYGPTIAFLLAVTLEGRSEFSLRLGTFLLLLSAMAMLMVSTWADRCSPGVLGLHVFANWFPQLWLAWVICFSDLAQVVQQAIRDFREFR